MTTLSKEIIKKYDIEIEGDTLHIHNSDGNHNSYIGFPGGFKVEESDNEFQIKCKNAVITLWKKNHIFHVTIF